MFNFYGLNCPPQRNSEPQQGCSCSEPVNKQEYDCGRDQTVIKHQHVGKHQHDIINEYDVVHEHQYNYYDVVREREVVKRNDYTTRQPNYCDNDCGCNGRRR